jgi:hypothetical protein
MYAAFLSQLIHVFFMIYFTPHILLKFKFG